MLKNVKKILGGKLLDKIRPLYHGGKSLLASCVYGFPGKKMKIIAITGTKGKTTTTLLTGRLMNIAGLPTGYISTAGINCQPGIENEYQNPYKMTTIDGITMQRLLREMVKNGCKYCVLELSSIGLVQRRNFGIGKFAAGVFLNMYPEHLDAHGGWDNYVSAKRLLFENLESEATFIANGNPEQIELSETMWKGVPNKQRTKKILISKPIDYQIESSGIHKELVFHEKKYATQFLADFEIDNLVYAINAVQACNPNFQISEETISKLGAIPGRMEFAVKDGSILGEKTSLKNNLSVLVDYAHEPASMQQLLQTIRSWKAAGFVDTIIHILSCDGVGRDDWKKPVMGKISFDLADYSVLTTDNYDENDNPSQIVEALGKELPQEKGADISVFNLEHHKYLSVIDRKNAFIQSLDLAKKIWTHKPQVKILIVSTGVGSEMGLTQPYGKIEWDEVQVWKELVRL